MVSPWAGFAGGKRSRHRRWTLAADDASCVRTMLAVAAGDIFEEAFVAWLRALAVARG